MTGPMTCRDVDGTVVDEKEARRIVLERYTVPAEVRKRTTKGTRRATADRRAERAEVRGSSPQ